MFVVSGFRGLVFSNSRACLKCIPAVQKTLVIYVLVVTKEARRRRRRMTTKNLVKIRIIRARSAVAV